MTDGANVGARARGLLQAQGVQTHVETLRAWRRRIVELERELARIEQRVTWWDRVLFFQSTPDEARAKRTRQELEAARDAAAAAKAAWSAAVSACCDYTPIDIVFQLESIIDDVVTNPKVGRAAKANEQVAAALERVAERIRAQWLPAVDLAAMVARLADDTARRQAAMSPAEPRRPDDALGWAPIAEDELFRRVSHALETSSAFAATRATATRELSETNAWMAQLEQARAQVKWHDVLIPGKGARERTVHALENEVERELMESAHALDELRLTVVRAFAVHPIPWLYFALLGVSAALRAAKPGEVATLAGDADVERVVSGAPRAVVLATLVEARRACEAAFGGVPREIWPRGRGQAAATPRAANGPYRIAGREADPLIVADLAEEETAFFNHLEQCDVRPVLGRAVSIATVYGLATLDLGRLDIAWLDRLAVWSDTPDEQQRDHLEARVAAYHASLSHFGDWALATVAQQALGHHAMVGLGHSLARANVDAAVIKTDGGSSSSPRHCPTVNKSETIASINAVLAVMQRFFAVRGDRGTWIDDLCRRLSQPAPIVAPEPGGITSYEHVIELLAAQLVGTEFVPLVQRVLTLRQQHGDAQRTVEEVASRVSFWDKVNFLSDTADETLRDQWKAHAAMLHQDLAGSGAEVERLLDGALAAYPPIQLYEKLWRALRLTCDIHARSERRTRTHTTRDSKGRVTSRRTEVYHVCVIYGVSEARSALEAATKAVLDAFGPLPTPSDALEAWIVQEL